MLSSRLVRQKSTLFQQQYKQGHKKFKQKKYDQALRAYEKAKPNFKINQDFLDKYVDMMLQWSRINKSRQKYGLAKQVLQNCQKDIREYYKNKLMDKYALLQKLQSQIKIYSELGQVFSDQLQKAGVKNDIQINRCVQYYQKCIQIAAAVLSNEQYIEILQKKQQLENWQALYAQTLNSSIDPLLLQTQRYNSDHQNYLTYKLIQKIADKMQKFYQLSHKNQRVTRVNARSWYYHGGMLLKTSNRTKQIKNYLKKDFQYCRKKNYIQDLNNTKKQLIKLYNRLQNFQELLTLLPKQLAQQFNRLHREKMNELKKYQSQVSSQLFIQQDRKKQLELIKNITNILEDQQYGWWARFPVLAKKVIPKVTDQQVLFQLCYQTATAYYQLFNQLNATSYCEQCFKYCEQGSDNYIQALILQIKIYERAEKYQKLPELDKKLKIITQSTSYKEIIQQNLKNRQFHLKRIKFFESKLLQTQEQKKLFTYLQRKKKQKQTMHAQQNSDNNDTNPNNNQQIRNQNYNFIKTKSNKQITLQKYKLICKLKGISQRNYILNQIQKLSNQQKYIKIDLGMLFDICPTQLQIYLQISNNNYWDLSNHRLSNNFLQKLSDKLADNQDNQHLFLKLSNVNKLISIETFEKLMKTLRNVQQIHLQKLARKFINQKINILGIPYCENLKILKLKDCNITDNMIEIISNSYTELVQLSLANNYIKGNTLHHLNKLRNLQKLNLSQNPLQSSNNLYNKSIKKLKLKKLKDKESSHNNLLFKQIKFLNILDLSQNNSKVVEQILKEFNSHSVQKQFEELEQFYQIRLKNCNISSQVFKQLNHILSISSSFNKLDIRFSHYEISALDKFSNYLRRCNKIINIDERACMGQFIRQI